MNFVSINDDSICKEESACSLPQTGEATIPKVKLLKPLSEITLKEYAGPLDESNKVFNGLYAGCFPGDISDEINDGNLIKLLNYGINKFVCMQEEYNPHAKEEDWRVRGVSKRPYFADIQRIVSNKESYPGLKMEPKDISFEHCPIKDLKTISDYVTLEIAKKVVRALEDGDIVYVHCWGGHGRTGIIICLVLHLMFGLNGNQAIEYCERVHMMRLCAINVRSPQTFAQRSQVIRIINSQKK